MPSSHNPRRQSAPRSRPPVKRIRTDVVREAPGLGQVRDAGINVGQQRRTRRQKSPYPVMTIVVAVLGLAAIGWMLSWETAPSGESAPSAATAATTTAAEPEPERDPTPRFACEGSTELRLAIDPAHLTALAFHQAAGESALPVTSLVPDADMALAAELRAVPPVTPQEGLEEGLWDGVCLRLWRSNRGGEPDTAIDMGADPGTPVWSPVSGEVIEVRPYLLYDKYEDFEIHIRPEGREDVDVVLIHVADVAVQAGDRVKAGVTRLATVRQMSDKIEIQLGGYTANGGDHVHIQLNSVVPGGALSPTGGS